MSTAFSGNSLIIRSEGLASQREATELKPSAEVPTINGLVEELHGDLRKVARFYMRKERSGHTLQTSALVNETYLRLIRKHEYAQLERGAVLALAASIMRRVLVDHARRVHSQKRGGECNRVELYDLESNSSQDVEILALNDALESLHQLDARKAKIIELKYFGGLSFDEIAENLDISRRTAIRDWNFSKAWLRQKLQGAIANG